MSHRIAERRSDTVLAQSHEREHFVLVTGDDYASIAGGAPPEGRPVLVYNRPVMRSTLAVRQ